MEGNTNSVEAHPTTTLNLPAFKDGGTLAKLVYGGIRPSDRKRIVETLDDPDNAKDYILGLRNVLDGPLPYSRSLKGREAGNGQATASKLWVGDEPDPINWVIDGLVPERFMTILFAQYESFKSYLAMLAVICICLGIPFLGRQTRRCNVLWIDRELNKDETQRRAFQVSRGLGFERPPEGLFYFRPSKPIGHKQTDTEIKAIVRQHNIELAVLDSLSVGSIGDMKEQNDVVSVLNGSIESWGITTICIDHITKAAGRGNLHEATPYGSTFKGALSRSMLGLIKADGGGLTLRHQKSNFSVRNNPIHFKVEFSGPPTTVKFIPVEETDPSMAGITDHMPAREQTLVKLKERYAESNGVWISAEELADALNLKKKTIQNHVYQLGDRVQHDGEGRYRPFPIPGAIGIGNREGDQ